MASNIMVDTETFGTRPGCVVRSLGACAFDPASGEIGATFYANIDADSCRGIGLHVDPNTQAWWARQSKEAQDALLVDPQPLAQVLDSFNAFWRAQGGVYLWAHAPNFDEVILQAVYRAVGRTPPWKYWNARCTRTIYALAGNIKPNRAEGVHHNALDDAKAQAAAVGRAYQIIGRAA